MQRSGASACRTSGQVVALALLKVLQGGVHTARGGNSRHGGGKLY